jgi:hypothetical protein
LREVSLDEGINLALKNNFYFKETSCVENKNVSDSFQTIIELTNFEMKKNLSKSKGKKLHKGNEKPKKKSFC